MSGDHIHRRPDFAAAVRLLTGREAAPQAIRDTREFSAICPASSAFMCKVLA